MSNVPTHVKAFMELHGYVFKDGKFEKRDDLDKFNEMFGGIFNQEVDNA